MLRRISDLRRISALRRISDLHRISALRRISDLHRISALRRISVRRRISTRMHRHIPETGCDFSTNVSVTALIMAITLKCWRFNPVICIIHQIRNIIREGMFDMSIHSSGPAPKLDINCSPG
jgi:hypothetical protein